MLHKDIRNWLSNKCKDLIQAGQPANLKLIQEELVEHFGLWSDDDVRFYNNKYSEDNLAFRIQQYIFYNYKSLR